MNFPGFTIYKGLAVDSDGIVYRIVENKTENYIMITLPVTCDRHREYREIEAAVEKLINDSKDKDGNWC